MLKKLISMFCGKSLIERDKLDTCACGNSEYTISGYKYTCTRCDQVYIHRLERAVIEAKGMCPDCGEILLEGPSGGCSTNYRCKNGHGFNITSFGSGMWVERI